MNTKPKAQKGRSLYEAPEVVVYGNVTQITRQNGTQATDVPIGTPSGTPGGVTGDFS